MKQILCKEARQTLAVLILLLCVAGCVRTPHFEVLNSSSESLVPADSELPVSYRTQVSLDYPLAKGDTSHVVTSMRRAIVANALGWQFDTVDVDTAVKIYVDSLAKDFRALASEMSSAGMYEGGREEEVAEWFDTITGYYAGSKGHYSSYVIEVSGYSGGAHPESGVIGLVFNLLDGSQLTLDDLFVPGFDEVLGELITSHVAESLPEGGEEALFTTSIMPTGNFVLTGRSITFIYNPYEIGPYSLGPVHISVPVKECASAGILAVKL